MALTNEHKCIETPYYCFPCNTLFCIDCVKKHLPVDYVVHSNKLNEDPLYFCTLCYKECSKQECIKCIECICDGCIDSHLNSKCKGTN